MSRWVRRGRRGRSRAAAVLVAAGVLVVTIVVAVVATGGGDSQNGEPSAPSRAEATSAQFETFDGEVASLADYRGTPLVLNFFASWCVSCQAEMPRFEALHQRLGDRVAFVGLNLQDSVADGEAVIARTGITYDTGRDPTGAIFQAFEGSSMPTTVLIDTKGRIVSHFYGEVSAEELEAEIRRVLL